MEKSSSILRWVIIGVVAWLAYQYLPKMWGGGSSGKSSDRQLLGPESACGAAVPCTPEKRIPEKTCDLDGQRFRAQFTTQGASLKHLWLEGQRYTDHGQPIDLVTTPDVEQRRPLRFDWRTFGTTSQVAYDAFDWTLEPGGPNTCVFTYADDKVQMRRVVRPSPRPFELEVEATIKNLAEEKLRHRLSVEAVSWRLQSEVESKLGRQSPFITDVSCMANGKAKKLTPGDFEPGDFSDKEFQGGWFTWPGAIDYAAVSNFYFSQALVPVEPQASSCIMLIEERWNVATHPDKSKDPQFGAMYRSRLAYDSRELGPGESATYKVLAFMGPKERDVLATAAGGQHRLSNLVDLGFFSIIAKYLLQYLVWLHSKIGNWGIAIILMTVSVRLLLFPLTWKSIQSGSAMRKLKPEIDAINQKYKDDAQQKNVATMELWKKHKVNPVGGCLPAIFQLPVWWALYTALQTAVELYHTPFVWFRDLSAPDPYYVLPVVLGGTMIIQQKMMPQQLDATQQKMMTYVMPAVFTVMMWFMPSGLAVYMLTNAVLGILQQLGVEKYYAAMTPPPGVQGSQDKGPSDKNATGAKKGNGSVQKISGRAEPA